MVDVTLETTMHVTGLYIYNSTQNLWLQPDENSWGPFETAYQYVNDPDMVNGARYRVQGTDDVHVFIEMK
jgi:hypothetical protein